MIQEIIYANLLPILALCMLIVFAIKNTMFNRRQSILFICTIAVNLMMLILTSVDYVCSMSKTPNIYFLRRITSFLNFATSPLVPLFLIMIFKERKLGYYYYIPVIMNSILCFLSIFLPNIVFYITENNRYTRGVVFFLPFIASILYILLFMFQKVKGQSRSKRNERYYILYVIFTLSLSMVLEIVFYFRMLTWVSCALGLILYYLLLNIQNIIIDPLTGANNRLLYNRELEMLNRRVPCYIAMIDLNHFKEINDRYGHAEGDRRLIKTASIMQRYISYFGKVYRIGGDEFVLITRKMNYNYFLRAVQQVRTTCKLHEIDLACGIVEYKTDEEISDALKRADELMYAEKAEIKRILLESKNASVSKPVKPTLSENGIAPPDTTAVTTEITE